MSPPPPLPEPPFRFVAFLQKKERASSVFLGGFFRFPIHERNKRFFFPLPPQIQAQQAPFSRPGD